MTADPGIAEMEALHARAQALAFPETLGDFIAERAASLGAQTACVYFVDGDALSYADIDEGANRLASSLVAIGVRKGAHVAVMLPNVSAFPVTWVAIARIGAVMVPVNASYTGAELGYVLNDSDAQYLVIDESLLEVFEAMPERPALLAERNVIVRGDARGRYRAWQDLRDGGEPSFEAPSLVTRSDLLNIQYTSGTTGFPKGCMLSHQYWIMLSHLAGSAHDPDEIRNVLIWAPFYYMDPMWQLLMAFRLGGTAYVARRLSATRFLDWLRTYEINYCAFPEALLVQHPPSPEDARTPLSYVNAFGWRPEAIAEFERRFKAAARDAFGMTEIGVGTLMPRAAGHMLGSGSCGLPGPFRELKIVDEDENEVPTGEVGELWVAGRGLLWGYYKKPEANRQSFRGRWFRTGDLFRRDEAGYHYIVGRLKDMIKRSGENVSALEVEAALCDMAGIEEAAVVPVPDPVRKEEVKAYVLLQSGLTPDDVPPERIFAHCAERLAKFKVPRYLAYVDAFPRTPSQKIAKPQLVAQADDLCAAAYDRVDGVWR
jgi:long-chain acyl-CoA synthetase/crotonobetaine/carnitine-CoA ligase